MMVVVLTLLKSQAKFHIGSDLCALHLMRNHVFLQMYIYDTENEISNRLRFFNNSDQHNLSDAIVGMLSQMLNTYNGYARLFENASDICRTTEGSCYSIRLYSNVPDRRYGAPFADALGGIVCGDDFNASNYDIIIHSKDGMPQRVSKLHQSYMPLQYLLLFPFGEEGWSPKLQLRKVDGSKDKGLTVNMYYSYQIHERAGVYSLLLNGGRLFQQYLVDAYSCIEQNRLDYYKANHDLFLQNISLACVMPFHEVIQNVVI
ncbi:hypothetical protein Hdeb2414_s0002g00062321 [Helianthus debilis subsp. tardiflorus]